MEMDLNLNRDINLDIDMNLDMALPLNTPIKFAADGLIPCIVVDSESKDVLMLGYMNQESLKLTLETRRMTYFSRSRKSLWIKGETSGNRQRLIELKIDCDQDTLIAMVEQIGPACHCGTRTCFETSIYRDEIQNTCLVENRNENFDENRTENSAENSTQMGWENLEILKTLSDTITERRLSPVEGSYTNYLLDKGIDKILKKVGEEATETIIGAKNSPDEMVSETADLIYHLLVLYEDRGVRFSEVLETLARRHSPRL